MPEFHKGDLEKIFEEFLNSFEEVYIFAACKRFYKEVVGKELPEHFTINDISEPIFEKARKDFNAKIKEISQDEGYLDFMSCRSLLVKHTKDLKEFFPEANEFDFLNSFKAYIKDKLILEGTIDGGFDNPQKNILLGYVNTIKPEMDRRVTNKEWREFLKQRDKTDFKNNLKPFSSFN